MSQHECNQDDRWVRSVVEQYEGPLVRYAFHIVGDLDRARDVVQDTFMRFCRAERRQLDDHVAEWLFTVCRNRALDVRRKEKRMKTITADQAAAQQSREAGQAQTVEQRDSAGRIQQLLLKLTENQQEVIRLKFQNDLSYREISGITGLSISNVGYLIHTAIQKIRAEIAADSGT
jgi:RNA polymerase sigma-70 factor (ECF subfamily)